MAAAGYRPPMAGRTFVAAGDVGLYGLGALGVRNPLARRWVNADAVARLRGRLQQRAVTVLIGARFVPGLRLPTYTAAGALGIPLGRFVLAVVAGTLVWTTLLFGAAFALGRVALEQLGPWRWAVAAVLVVGVWLIERAIARNRARRPEVTHG